MSDIMINNENRERGVLDFLNDNKEYIYPALFYTAGLIIGSFCYQFIDNTIVTRLMKNIFETKDLPLYSVVFNDLSINALVFAVTVLFGLCLIGFPFVNIIPLVIGIEAALKISYYYVSYSAKGVGFSVLMIIPKCAAIVTIIIYTIKYSSKLSKSIYDSATKKSDTLSDAVNLKMYLKKYLICFVYVVIISVAGSCMSYLFSTIITI